MLDTAAIVHYLDSVETVVLDADIWCQLQMSEASSPTLVAPESNAFSTSSFTTPWRSRTTCPEWMRCTDSRSMAGVSVGDSLVFGGAGTRTHP